jgi:hypothetical protein
MKKALSFILIIVLTSFQKPVQEKKFKFEFTDAQVGVIYKALQSQPFAEVAPIIYAIEDQYRKQTDTTKPKK